MPSLIEAIKIKYTKLSLKIALHLRKILNYEKQPIHDLDILSQMLKEELFVNLDAKKHNHSLVTCEHSTLVAFTKHLRDINISLRLERNVNEKIKELYPTTTDFFRFFVNDEGYYVSHTQAIVAFKKELDFYVDYLKQHHKEEVGIKAHNCRVLRNTTAELVQTSLTLIEHSVK